MKKFEILLLILSSSTAFANLDISQIGGRQKIEFINVGPAEKEICVLPTHFAGAAYENILADDGSTEEIENKLCSIDLHNSSDSAFGDKILKPAAVCPKLNSTNPGLDIFKIAESSSKDQMEAKVCKMPDLQKIAKYKVSTSCSYTPSILGYYHLSRMLGDILHVPVSVIRTVDQKYHLDQAQKGLKNTSSRDIIHQTFQTLVMGLGGQGSASFNDRVLTNQKQSYGALLQNLKKEELYKEFFNTGADPAMAFKQKNPYYRMLSSEKPLAALIAKNYNKANLQSLIALKDLSEMLIMDYLMNQKDRFGNIAFLNFAYFKDKAGLIQRGNEGKPPAGPTTQAGAFIIKEMVLKDNDCGGSDRPNVMKISGLTLGLRHLNPATYHRLLWINASIDNAATKDFFNKEILFTAQDQSTFRSNLADLSASMKALCQQGKLKLDLDYNDHFLGVQRADSQSCDLN